MPGIVVAGSILVDKINEISAYPNAGELTQIRSVSRAVGGLVPNVSIDLKALDPALPVYAVGKVGEDAEGDFLFSELEGRGVDCHHIRRTGAEKTSFTDVMSITGGQRTFFTYPGASADFGFDDVDFGAIDAEMLHLGYFLLLDKVDAGDGVRILREAKERGMRTSIDLVSENSDRYAKVLPCLPYTDNLIVNELEAGKLTGMDPAPENFEAICKALMAAGVRERVIIHMKNVAVLYSARGFFRIGSIDLPREMIRGTTGAGDAFCSGALLGIYRGLSDEEILDLATVATVGALSRPDAVSGMKTVAELRAVAEKYPHMKV